MTPLPLEELLARCKDLVSLPEIYYRAQELLDDPNSDSATLGRVIESDTGLTARLLRLVNSPLYGLPARIERVSYAVTMVGRKALRDLVLATVVLRAFAKISPKLVDLSMFWHHSVFCGTIAKTLAKNCSILHTERMMVAGILHDVGQLVIYQWLPEAAAEVLQLASPRDDGVYLAERQVFGYTHADVGAALLRNWNLPESLWEIVAWHHEPRGARTHVIESCLIHLANSIANREEPARHIVSCEPSIDPYAWETTGLTEAVIDPSLNLAHEDFLDLLDILMPRTGML